MSQSNKQIVNIGRETRSTPDSKATDSGRQRKWTGFIIAAVVVVVILAILGGGYYQNYVSPFQRTIITVDDTSINMDYFLKRFRFTNTDPMSMIQLLTNEQLIKLAAPRYGIQVSQEDIIHELRNIARGESEVISESEFQEWYRQELNNSGLSDSEYKDIMTTSILAARLQAYLAETIPTVGEHVYIHRILAESFEAAVIIRERWEAGEDFADLARETALDEEDIESGGAIGWMPRGVMAARFEYAIFDLSPGELSLPIPAEAPTSVADVGQGSFFLFMVSEKTDSREIDEEYLPIIKDGALGNWLTEESQFHEITWNFNSEISAWLNWQLSKN